MDPYLTPRSLSTPMTVFAVACYISNSPAWAVVWLALTALIHPQMSVYGVVFIGFLRLARHSKSYAKLVSTPGLAAFAGLPLLFEFQPARGAAREALLSRTYFFVSNWAWYEWIGAAAPLALAWWFASRKVAGTTPAFRSLLKAFLPFGLLFTAAGLALTTSPRLENFTRLQPMRAFHVLYVIFFALLGGLIGDRLLRSSAWRWLCLFVPLAGGMFLLQQSQYPSSAHVEWPGYAYRNAWNSAFSWVRLNTPKDAVFALDPGYMLLAGEDQHGFRAVAERSALADAVKDSGVVSLFPGLADDWKSEVQAQTGWAKFDRRDFDHLATHYPVTWIVTSNPAPAGLICPYRSEGLSVCHIGSPGPAPLGE